MRKEKIVEFKGFYVRFLPIKPSQKIVQAFDHIHHE